MEGEIPSSLSNCSNLKFLNLHGNKLKGKVPTELGSLMKLKLLQLGINNLVGGIPPSLGNLSSLTKFGVADNNLVGNIPDAIGQLNGLVFFTISFNKLSSTIPSSLYNVSSLQIFSVSGNQLNGTLSANIGLNLPNLQNFYVGGNEFSRSIPTSLCNATQLQRIDLVKNKFLESVPTNLGNLLNLSWLDLSHNYLGKNLHFLTSLTNCSRLKNLVLALNQFDGVLPNSVSTLSNELIKLYFGNNEISGTIPGSLANLVNLIGLGLNENHFIGVIPTAFGKLIGTSSLPLVNINLSHNSFMGKLPFEAGNLKNINEMDISNNNLSSEIPTSIGNYVSQNNLSGPIPKGLEKLFFFEKLNLSFNNFEGEVPIKGVFKNISALSLIGNTKLCGGMQKLQLTKCPVNVMKPRKSIRFKHAIVIISIVQIFLLFSSFIVWMKKSRKKSPSMVSTMDLINFSYKELYQETNGFSRNNLIGSGSFGSVYKGFIHLEERTIAVKVLNLHKKGASKSFMVECNALRNIQHRNLVKILTCCSSMDYNGNQFKALVFEFMTNGSLDFWLHQGLDNENQSMNLILLQRLNVAIDVAFAIDYLHNHSVQPIIHCDLKPSVLLDNDTVAHYDMGDETSIEADTYSYRILLLEMFLGKRPTDDMFKDGLNVHNFAKTALPKELVQIVGPILLPREVDEAPIAIVATRDL
ncbi:hypothetical protein RGQ29_013687 [Quercus rubra]|uniref:Protein kinase domain-containing protein n=1 Tax=Quercus rubra TaxID=3512 RepID=A0AAN7FK71_QUERU|nr:hypothetical protein RGQ29_013687 [Quercus rubra]